MLVLIDLELEVPLGLNENLSRELEFSVALG